MKHLRVWTVAGCAAMSLVAFMIWRATGANERVQPKRPVTRETYPAVRESPQVALLAREVAELRAEVQRAQDEAPRLVASAVTESPPGTESEVDLSPQEKLELRVAQYDERLAAETRDAVAAEKFEQTLDLGFATIEHSSLDRVDCRATLCRIEIRHNDRSAREKFGDFVLGSGPLKYGTFDYLSEDGQRTIAYVGMPGHPLM